MTRHPEPRLLLLALVTSLIAGCSPHANPVAVANRDAGGGATEMSARAGEDGDELSHLTPGFYPLQLGNHWTFDVTSEFRFGPTGGPPTDSLLYRERQQRELVCREAAADRRYVVEETRADDGTQTSTWWVRYRQDRSGLYELDTSLSTPPLCVRPAAAAAMARIGEGDEAAVDRMSARIESAIADPVRREAALAAWRAMRERLAAVSQSIAAEVSAPPTVRPPGGVAPGEITRLGYPLRRGMRWIIRDDPRYWSVVQGLDVVPTPKGPVPAWRIAIHSELFGPRDRVHLWVSRAGFVQLAAHLESEGTDTEVQPVLTTWDLLERLVDWKIAHRPRLAERDPVVALPTAD